MTGYRTILERSPFLGNAVRLCGWEPAFRRRRMDGMVNLLQTRCDWRIETLLGLNEAQGLGLTGIPGGSTSSISTASMTMNMS